VSLDKTATLLPLLHLTFLVAGIPFSYFLCYEDIPNAHADIPNADADADSQGVSHGSVVRMWSIGLWVQVTPITEDIYEW